MSKSIIHIQLDLDTDEEDLLTVMYLKWFITQIGSRLIFTKLPSR